jgi:hypothetical protein
MTVRLGLVDGEYKLGEISGGDYPSYTRTFDDFTDFSGPLNHLGGLGWELVSVVPVAWKPDDWTTDEGIKMHQFFVIEYRLVFKRPRTE